jgi:hypothetical protein
MNPELKSRLLKFVELGSRLIEKRIEVGAGLVGE